MPKENGSVGSLIKPKHVQEFQRLNVLIEKEVFDELKLYCEFAESPQAYVVSQALQYVFQKDKAFQEHVK